MLLETFESALGCFQSGLKKTEKTQEVLFLTDFFLLANHEDNDWM